MSLFGVARFILLAHLCGSMVSFGIMLLRVRRPKDHSRLWVFESLLFLSAATGWLYAIDTVRFLVRKHKRRRNE